MTEHIEGEEVVDPPNDDCKICGHPFNPHALVATLHSPEHGGLIFCPEKDCMCESTWSLQDHEPPYIPDDEAVAALRAMVQNGDHTSE